MLKKLLSKYINLMLSVVGFRPAEPKVVIKEVIKEVPALPRKISDEEVVSLFEQTMRQLNCEFVKKEYKESVSYKTEFQGGKFSFRLPKGLPIVEISFPDFFVVSQDNIEIARSVANDMDLRYRFTKFVYYIDFEKRVLRFKAVTDVFFMPSMYDLKHFMTEMLVRNFEFRREFKERFDLMLKDSRNKLDDPESHLANQKREMFMLRGMEMLSEGRTKDAYSIIPETPTLNVVMEDFIGIDFFTFESLRIDTGGEKVRLLSDPCAIGDYRIFDALIGCGSNGNYEIEYQRATLTIGYRMKGDAHKLYTAVLILTSEGDDDVTIYIRATICILPVNLDHANSASSGGHKPKVYSLLFGCDRVGGNHREQEFLYMWEDAQEKYKAGNVSSLTFEQLMIADCQEINLARLLYWGRKFYLNRRYYEAVHYLQNVYDALAPRFHDLPNLLREKFLEVSYYIGCCYNELHLYHLAFNYLEPLLPQGKDAYTMAYINLLVASEDFRAMPIIQKLLEAFDEQLSKMDEEDPHFSGVIDLFRFTRSREAMLLIKWNKFDEAEKILQSILDDPKLHDVVLESLATIQRKRREEEVKKESKTPEGKTFKE